MFVRSKLLWLPLGLSLGCAAEEQVVDRSLASLDASASASNVASPSDSASAPRGPGPDANANANPSVSANVSAGPSDAGCAGDACLPPDFDASVSAPADAGTDPDGGAICFRGFDSFCTASEFCRHPDEAKCSEGNSAITSRCAPKPTVCPDLHEPVCGCDRRSYGNRCQANAAGTSIWRAGLCSADECRGEGGSVHADGTKSACDAGERGWQVSDGAKQALCCAPTEMTPRRCGGDAGLPCLRGQFCNVDPAAGGTGCGGSGVCTDMPTACDLSLAPVCGCDHKYHATVCTAHARGTSILHNGSCTQADCTALGGYTIPANPDLDDPVCPKGESAYGGYDQPLWLDRDGGAGKWCCVPGERDN